MGSRRSKTSRRGLDAKEDQDPVFLSTTITLTSSSPSLDPASTVLDPDPAREPDETRCINLENPEGRDGDGDDAAAAEGSSCATLGRLRLRESGSMALVRGLCAMNG